MTVSRRKFLASSAFVGGAALFGGVGVGASGSRASAATADTASTLSVALKNNTASNTVYAFVTGQAVSNNALVLLESDGRTLYYPASPGSTGAPLAANCAIPLGGPGSTTTITIPQIAGGRVWFSIGSPLTFLLNPGPALVEPSVSNPSDPNINLMWDFCEFTFNTSQLYADISYVDFVSIPIAISLTDTSGAVQNVTGMPAGGLDTVCSGLVAQHNADGAGWDQLIVTSGGANLRALSPNNGIVMNSSLFSGYFQPYIDQVWSKYESASLTVDTQASWGSVTGNVSGGVLNFPGLVSYAQPAAKDIFSCSTGPFANTAGEIGAVSARICAAFNRSTLLIDSDQPDGEVVSTFYQNTITNHYSRIVHAANTDGLGYAFPYDDVVGNGANQSGFVASGNPALWTITLGGGGGGSTPPPHTVTVSSPGDQTSTVGAAANLQVSGTDSSGGPLTFTASGLPTGASISAAGLITGTLGTAGSFSTTVTATDSGGASGSTSFTWTVNTAGSGGGCTGAPAWSATTAYVPGNQVTYAGDLWTSTWYSTNAVPNAPQSWDVWKNDGAC
ncbi:beta-1,3-glucanase family protein [Catenulispora pinistramenti]|uniref:beta-1,3-glucanase family protein n=1 Tax=Catenulispora pinistramenti TaxID=2705254 RepID=UPI001E475E41|nr:beta-1,3-glucanase family protein [Catenulispora pinistramenti]